jgi:hypothetical protein
LAHWEKPQHLILDRAAKVLRGSSAALPRTEGTEKDGEEEEEEEDDEEDEEDAYDYDMEDPDVDPEPAEKKHRCEDSEVSADDFFTGQGSAIAVHRLISDFSPFISSLPPSLSLLQTSNLSRSQEGSLGSREVLEATISSSGTWS